MPRRRPQRSANLRRSAEEELRARKAESAPDSDANYDPRSLVEELRMHQIELEMQNAELQRVRWELETTLARYVELFDFAPVGYVVLDADVTIRALNLAGAQLLRAMRTHVVGRNFATYVSERQRQRFTELVAQVVTEPAESQAVHRHDLSLVTGREVHVTMTATQGHPSTVLVALEDITARKRAEATQAAITRRLEALDKVAVLMNRHLTERAGDPLSGELLQEIAEIARAVCDG